MAPTHQEGVHCLYVATDVLAMLLFVVIAVAPHKQDLSVPIRQLHTGFSVAYATACPSMPHCSLRSVVKL